MVSVKQVFDLTQKINAVTSTVVMDLFEGRTRKVALDLSDNDGNVTHRVEVKTVRARKVRATKKATTTTRKTRKKATKKTRTTGTRKKATRRTK